MVRLDRPAAFDSAASRNVLKNLPPLSSAVSPKPPPSPADQVAHLIRTRLGDVLRGVAGKLKNAEYSTQFLSLAQRRVLEASPEELRPQLIQRFQQDNQARLQGLRSAAASVNRPYSPQERSENLQQSARALRSSMEQSFASLERYARAADPLDRDHMMQKVAWDRSRAFESLEAGLAQLTRDGASSEDIRSAQLRIADAVNSVGYTSQRLLASLPREMQPLAQAEFALQQDSMNLAKYSLHGKALQPSSPTDLSKLRGTLPPLTGALTAAQAKKAMEQLEGAIKVQYLERLDQAKGLPAELRDAAVFEAEAQRDRMLVNAYRNVLGRVVDVLPPPPFPKS